MMTVVRLTWSTPPSKAYFLIAENFSIENSKPIINNKNMTPSSAMVVIISVELINWPKTIPVRKRPIIDGSLSLLNINRITTAVIKIIDIFSSKNKSILLHNPF